MVTKFATNASVTLPDEDTESILTDSSSRAIQGNVAMHVTLPGGQRWNQCKWCHLVAKFVTEANIATWWPQLEPMLIGTNASGILFSWRDKQVLDAIPWVRCASDNVLLLPYTTISDPLTNDITKLCKG